MKYFWIAFCFFFSSCSYNPHGFLKLSANNKIIDRTGFQGSKRLPLYNNKYIDRAKKNIAFGNYEIPKIAEQNGIETDESFDPISHNIEVYNQMMYLEKEASKKSKPSVAKTKPIQPSKIYGDLKKLQKHIFDKRYEQKHNDFDQKLQQYYDEQIAEELLGLENQNNQNTNETFGINKPSTQIPEINQKSGLNNKNKHAIKLIPKKSSFSFKTIPQTNISLKPALSLAPQATFISHKPKMSFRDSQLPTYRLTEK